ncbi:MAG: hypothetical protein GY826_25640, partial [Fuerstiella sp.]|nr:hypothetical protein [Fuerstiella sp.]
MSSRSPSSTAVERRNRRVWNRRWLVCLATLTAVAFVFWWQDQPLREISTLLQAEDYSASLTMANQYLSRHPDDSRAR